VIEIVKEQSGAIKHSEEAGSDESKSCTLGSLGIGLSGPCLKEVTEELVGGEGRRSRALGGKSAACLQPSEGVTAMDKSWETA